MAAYLAPSSPAPFEDRTGTPTQQLREGSGAAMLTAKNRKQPIPLPWSWEEFASSPYCATSNFLTQITKLLKPDSAASGRHGRKPLGTDRPRTQTKSARNPQTHPSLSTVTRDKFAFRSNDVPKPNAGVAIFPRNISSGNQGAKLMGSRGAVACGRSAPQLRPEPSVPATSQPPHPPPCVLRPASRVPALHAPRPAPPPPSRSGL